MNATIATIETISNVVHIDATTERTDTINIDENDMSAINTNTNTNATIANAIDTNATNERTNTINIDENDVNVINTNADTNATKKIVTKKTTNTNITIASNEENNKKKEKEDVVTIDLNDEKMRFDEFCESKKANTIEQNSKTIKTKNSIANIKFFTIFLTMSRIRSLTIKSR